jgi:IS1 family transposase
MAPRPTKTQKPNVTNNVTSKPPQGIAIRERSRILHTVNVLPAKTRRQVVACLIEGVSVRSTCRLTGVAKGTVLKLLADLGAVCEEYQDLNLRNLRSQRVQCDEIWSFCYAKDKNAPSYKLKGREAGSIWTWTALDADTKLMISYHVGTRDARCATHFMRDVASRLANRVQLTTDGHHAYLQATSTAFGGEVDYGRLVKIYGPAPSSPETRYSQPQCIGAKLEVVDGAPDEKHISTSFVERSNLTMRMSMRRYTRLTNAFSKKVENHEHAVALNFMHYNFCRVHQTLKTTPAVAAGVTDHVWTLDELIALLPKPTRAPWGSKNPARRAKAAEAAQDPGPT